jgi:phage protein D
MIDFPSPRNLRTSVVPEATPITMNWGMAPLDVRTFYGYVNHHEIVEEGGASFLRVFCLGTSMPLNNPNPSSWNNVSASYVARRVAERHHLRAVLHQSTAILPYWAQGTESDFTMMKRLADQAGFRFWVDGSTLYFLNPDILVRLPQMNSVPTYAMDRNAIHVDNLKSIHLIDGSLAPRPTGESAKVQQVYGIDANNNLIRATSAPTIADRGLTTPTATEISNKAVSSLAEARQITDASASRGAWVTTKATMEGAATLRPGDLANLRGEALHSDYHGLWLVKDGVHVIEPNKDGRLIMSSDMELTRNQRDYTYFTLNTTIKGAQKTVPAVLRDGKRWESEILEAVYA